MPIEVVSRYSRAEIRASPDKLFVFGDNLTGLGRGGQAKECRGERNAVGITTKFHPGTDPSDFVYDHHLPALRPVIQQQFRKLAEHLRGGGVVVWPADGVGTGLARLPETAPTVMAFIDRCRAHLESIADGNGGAG